ncbi:hypothetical protein Taro_047637 [Colocasia esculenta]|uniref:Uncharacterized protein n=1 Tax=Colocasia esculenta TaxID=4460 RepID=A0A843X7Z4_COLES|nr:hypothetical protein [Colocasia esculenta]
MLTEVETACTCAELAVLVDPRLSSRELVFVFRRSVLCRLSSATLEMVFRPMGGGPRVGYLEGSRYQILGLLQHEMFMDAKMEYGSQMGREPKVITPKLAT